jgi:hypothetical protein
MGPLKLCVDNRIGGCPRYYWGDGRPLLYIPKNIEKCIAFVGFRGTKGEEYRATGFFISIVDFGYPFSYFATAAHVIDRAKNLGTDGKILIRVNNKSGGMHSTETDSKDWIYHPADKSVDVAITGVDLENELDHLTYPMASIVTADLIKQNDIGVGDAVFLTGLLRGTPGKKHNIPIVRIGNIASMTDERIAAEQPYGEIEGYVIETKSIGGLSGSPVFVCSPDGSKVFYLLGLVHGHLGSPENFGISVVVPAVKILEILVSPDCAAVRKKIADENDQKHAAVPD